jgi:hypothetical protein
MEKKLEERKSKKAMSVIGMIQYLNTCSSCSNLVEGVLQCPCPIIIHAHEFSNQKTPGLKGTLS